MAEEQDQQPASDQTPPGLPPGSLPGNAFVPTPVPLNQRSLPGEFFNWTPEKQRDFLAQPDTLPRDLPERTLKTIGRAAPAIGAGAGAIAAQFIPGVPETELAAWLVGGAGAFMGGGGGSLAQSSVYKAINDPEAPKTWKETFERAGIEGWDQAKTELVWGGLGRATGKVLQKLFGPEHAYQRLLKPPAGRGQKVSGPLVETGLQERIHLTEGGAAKLSATIDKVNQDIENMISSSPGTIPASQYVQNIQKRLDILRKRYSKGAITGGTKGAAVATIDEAERRFLINHGNVKPLRVFKGRDPQGNPIWDVLKPEDMTLANLRARAQPMATGTAQAIKKQTYEELRTLYKERGQMVNIPGWSPGTHPGVATEATQELTRALREELGNIYPGLNELNARDGRLLDLDEAVNRFINRELNKGVYRWGAALLSGGGLTGALHAGGAANPEQWAGMLGAALIKGAIDDPAIGSYLAIALHDVGRGIGRVPGAAGLIRIVGQEALPTARRYMGVQQAKSRETQPPGEWVPAPGAAAGGGGQAAPPSQAAEPGEPSAPSQEPAPGAPSPPPAVAAQDTTRPPLRKLDQEALTRAQALKDFTGTYGWSNDEERMLQEAAQKYNVPLSLLLTVAEQEGSGKWGEAHHLAPRLARSPAGAIGLMQITPDTAKTFGYDNPEDMKDPRKNIEVAARYLSQLNKNPRYAGNPGMVLAAYNAGEKTLKDAGYNLAKMPKETRPYVLKGLRRWAQLSKSGDDLEQYLSTLPTVEEFEKNIPR